MLPLHVPPQLTNDRWYRLLIIELSKGTLLGTTTDLVQYQISPRFVFASICIKHIVFQQSIYIQQSLFQSTVDNLQIIGEVFSPHDVNQLFYACRIRERLVVPCPYSSVIKNTASLSKELLSCVIHVISKKLSAIQKCHVRFLSKQFIEFSEG